MDDLVLHYLFLYDFIYKGQKHDLGPKYACRYMRQLRGEAAEQHYHSLGKGLVHSDTRQEDHRQSRKGKVHCRYGATSYCETTMKDGTRYYMIQVAYKNGQGAVPTPVLENAQVVSEMTRNLAFFWMV